MKTCGKCKQEKELSEFHKNKRMKDGLARNCKVCACKARMDNYRTADGKATNDAYGRKTRHQNRIKLFEYLMEHPCVDCGEGNPVVLDFDHRDPLDKSYTIGGAGALFRSWKTVLKEIEKCDVRCANCHRIKTAGDWGWTKAKLYAEHLEQQSMPL